MSGEMKRLLEKNNQFSSWGDCISDLIDTAFCPVSLKDAQTGKYIYGNFHYAKRLGLNSVQNVIGLTADDLNIYTQWNFSDPFTSWKINDLVYIKKADDQVKATRTRHIHESHLTFTATGMIGCDTIIKIPIPGLDKRRSLAILSYGYDTHFKMSLLQLFQMYQQYYPAKQAVQQLLKHLNIDRYFIEPLTLREMRILLSMRLDRNYKYIASLLKIEPSTVNSHIRHMQSKLRTPGWHEVLSHLRAIPAGKHEYNA